VEDITAKDNDYDAIVIGAGFSGLRTAQSMNERGYNNVLVLEARNRVGGRAYPVQVTDEINFEMGCEWAFNRVFPRLYQEYGVNIGPETDPDKLVV